MTAISARDIAPTQAESPRPKLDHPMGIRTILIFLAVMALGLFFAAYNIFRDISAAGTTVTSILPFLLLGVALLIARSFVQDSIAASKSSKLRRRALVSSAIRARPSPII